MNENTKSIENKFSATQNKNFLFNDTLPNFITSSQTPLNIPGMSVPITPIPDFTIGFTSPDEQNSGRNASEKHIDSI